LRGALRSLKSQGASEIALGALIREIARNIHHNVQVLHKDVAIQRLYFEALDLLREERGEVSQIKVLARLSSGLLPDGRLPPQSEAEADRQFTQSCINQVEKAITKAIRETRERKATVTTKGRGRSIKTLARLASGLEE